MPPNTAANHGLPVQLSTPGASSIKPMPSGVQGNREEWLPLPPARLLQLMKSLAMVYVVAYLITQRHQWKTMIRDKSKCDCILNGYTVGREEGQHNQLDCTPRQFDSQTAKTCLRNSKVLFIGDSRIRALQERLIVLLDPNPKRELSKRAAKPRKDPRHRNKTTIIADANVHVLLIWDTYIGKSWLAMLRYLKSNPLDGADLIVAGAALWTIRRDPSLEGLDHYKVYTKSVLRLASSLVRESDTNLVWVRQANVNESVPGPRRSNMTNARVRMFNAAVDSVWPRFRTPGMFMFDPGHVPLLRDGVHFTEDATDETVQAILNVHCNSQLPVTDRKTCCQGLLHSITAPQVVLLVIFVCSIVILFWGVCCRHRCSRSLFRSLSQTSIRDTGLKRNTSSPVVMICQCITLLGIVLLYTYLADRTPVFTKEEKHFNWTSFAVPLAILGILGFVTYQPVKDASVLNRQQTCETRGWMQLVLLVYHYTGGSKILGLYYVARLIVAMYIFLSAFGHYTYGLKRGASSWSRVAEVLFRLNLYTVLLCLTMDVPYLHYYFVPLISACYLLVLLVAAIPPVAWDQNKSPWMQVLKAICFTLVVALYRVQPDMFNWIISFPPLSQLFLDDDISLHEWTFRFGLDVLAVPSGILCAVMLHRFPQINGWICSRSIGNNLMTILSAVTLVVYCGMMATNCTSKPECNLVHTYLSPIMLGGFVLVRNTWEPLRKHYSQFFDWVGIYSLELFIAQYHVLLANDTRSLLVLVEGNPILNICIVTTIFVLVSHTVAECTQMVVNVMKGLATEND
ncbi:N-acetylneuraminate 9-O-acetyltransferase-like isoform X2 [Sycon ciliatum]|uniref:N-acetylneuraminate 9-O-acetyltransferase-like isoform X2 n=1 Tax=Sycon ciliatum TaxID=27933 RepID=UPI0031F658BD